jgi:hypothetical protein
MLKVEKVKNLINIEDESVTLELIEKLKKGEVVSVSICRKSLDKDGRSLMWEGKSIFNFDVFRCGNSEYNAISVIRDLLNQCDTDDQWTRPKVLSLVSFSSKATESISEQ